MALGEEILRQNGVCVSYLFLTTFHQILEVTADKTGSLQAELRENIVSLEILEFSEWTGANICHFNFCSLQNILKIETSFRGKFQNKSMTWGQDQIKCMTVIPSVNTSERT